MPAWARKEIVILHEVAHTICPRWEHHGRLFARVFLELVRVQMGTAAEAELKAAFRKGKVKFGPRRTTGTKGVNACR